MSRKKKDNNILYLAGLAAALILFLAFYLTSVTSLKQTLKTEIVSSENCLEMSGKIADPKTEFDLSDISEIEKYFLKLSSPDMPEEELDLNADCKFSFADVISAIQCKNNENLPGQTCSAGECGTVCYPSLENVSSYKENFISGTEGQGIVSSLNNKDQLINIAKSDLGVSYLKFRLNQPSQGDSLVTDFTPDLLCKNPLLNCPAGMNFDKLASIYSENNLSMIPMISIGTFPSLRNGGQITTEIIDNYVDFVDWFVSRYKDKAKIEYLELHNNPSGGSWKGTNAQLLELNNKTYERIKKKYPEILIGTPGFEFFGDPTGSNAVSKISIKGLEMVDYFLDKKNNAKFDFLAFHGYAARGVEMNTIYPPNMTPENNKYSGISGMIEMRKKLNLNGWQDRQIINLEHTGIIVPSALLTDENTKLDAAFMFQYQLMQRTARVEGRSALNGSVAFKLINRCKTQGEQGECFFGSLDSDGSKTKAIDTVGLLTRSLKGLSYEKRISGNFDDFQSPWVEKFTSDNKELYVFFKPFENSGKGISFDNKKTPIEIELTKNPKDIKLIEWDGSKTDVNISKNISSNAENMPKIIEVTF